MSKFVIHAYESIYSGLYGMDYWFIEEGKNKSDVYIYAEEASRDVIDSYGCIYEKLRANAESNAEFDGYDDEDTILHYLEDEINDDIAYDVWALNDSGYALYDVMSEDEVDAKLYNEEEEFVKQYCLEE